LDSWAFIWLIAWSWFSSLIWCWMSSTKNPMSCVHSFWSMSSSSLPRLGSSLEKLQSFWVQCDTEPQVFWYECTSLVNWSFCLLILKVWLICCVFTSFYRLFLFFIFCYFYWWLKFVFNLVLVAHIIYLWMWQMNTVLFQWCIKLSMVKESKILRETLVFEIIQIVWNASFYSSSNIYSYNKRGPSVNSALFYQ
jgi:hypothetical protein